MTVHGRLYQARMWREYASEWGQWHHHILRVSRAECRRRARINLYLARRLNRSRA